MRTRIVLATLFLPFAAHSFTAQEIPQPRIANWPALALWDRPAAQTLEAVSRIRENVGPESALAFSTSSPMPFIPVTPCRVVDTRISGGAFGVGETRTYAMSGGPSGSCTSGSPPGIAAVSLNITVTQTAGTGFVTGYPTGGSLPLVSSVNWVGGNQTLSNAAIVPTDVTFFSNVNIYASQATDVILDINGYFAAAAVGTGNTFLGHNAGSSTTTGDTNTAIGTFALPRDTTGSGNTALGYAAALNLTTGSFNVQIGPGAGQGNVTGSSNIYIGNDGSNESKTIRIGDSSIQTATFIAGISGATSSGGVGVFVNGSGQLGTSTSSRRFKEDIREIGEESIDLMKLRPVAFRYKRELDPTGLAQYGLIAEEVAEVYPDLVAYDREGRPEAVRYHLVNALLLNEVQKQRRNIESQQAEIERLKADLSALRALVSRN